MAQGFPDRVQNCACSLDAPKGRGEELRESAAPVFLQLWGSGGARFLGEGSTLLVEFVGRLRETAQSDGERVIWSRAGCLVNNSAMKNDSIPLTKCPFS